MIYDCPYKNGITNIVINLIKKENENKGWLRKVFVAYPSYVSIIEAFYGIMLNEIDSIEKCEEKQMYWNEALKFEADRKKRIKIAKSIYVIEKVFEIKI